MEIQEEKKRIENIIGKFSSLASAPEGEYASRIEELKKRKKHIEELTEEQEEKISTDEVYPLIYEFIEKTLGYEFLSVPENREHLINKLDDHMKGAGYEKL